MDKQRAALLQTGLFLVVVPGTVLVLIPWWLTGWRVEAGLLHNPLIGIPLIGAGGLVILDSFRRFALEGLGTPAPIKPPSILVTSGFYRYVRNPMYVAVLAVLAGQTLLFGSAQLLAFTALAGLFCHLFVRFYEEPTLRRLFCADYDQYCAKVDRWLPRRPQA
jgi:protein-S-isoprenylcysteine O-methyltransferase Ste14